MKSCVNHHRAAIQEMRKIERWLESKKIDVDALRDGSGAGLEELEYGVDNIEVLCKRIEAGGDIVWD